MLFRTGKWHTRPLLIDGAASEWTAFDGAAPECIASAGSTSECMASDGAASDDANTSQLADGSSGDARDSSTGISL